MTGKFSTGSLSAAVALALLALGCEPGGVGDPCIPEDEYTPAFSSFSVGEVNVESRSFQCETRICLVNHFQGRVSCPYGQDPDDVANLAADDPARCRIPGTQDPITVPVDAQLVERQADKAVYCSCRCKGPDEGARYCECPSGYTCSELVQELGLPGGQLAGSYCVRNNTGYDPTKPPSQGQCSASAGNCDPEGTGQNP